MKVAVGPVVRKRQAGPRQFGFDSFERTLRRDAEEVEQPDFGDLALSFEHAQHLDDALDATGSRVAGGEGHRLTRVIGWPR